MVTVERGAVSALPMDVPERVAIRAASNVEERPTETGCIISSYGVGSHGYPQIGWSDNAIRRVTLVHRVVWISTYGAIPDGMTVDHMCKTRRCVNAEHLRLLTNFENARRTFGRDWPLGRCVNGHPNSELTRRGSKSVCRTCSAIWQRRYRRKAVQP